METNIVQIDLSKVDKDIKDIENHVLALQQELDLMRNLKKYAISISIDKSNGLNGHSLPQATKTVSVFIIDFLKERGTSYTRDVITAYAEHQGRKYIDVRNNVSNALTRLKQSNKIHSREKIDGRGSELYVK